jgi:hypothetical protein
MACFRPLARGLERGRCENRRLWHNGRGSGSQRRGDEAAEVSGGNRGDEFARASDGNEAMSRSGERR